MFGAAAMSLSSVCVVSNALRLRGFKPKYAASKPAATHAAALARRKINKKEKQSPWKRPFRSKA